MYGFDVYSFMAFYALEFPSYRKSYMRMSWQYLPSPNCVLRTPWYYQTSLGVSEKLIQLKRNVDHDDQSFCRHVEDFETHEVTNSPRRTSFRLFLLFVDICQSYCNNL